MWIFFVCFSHPIKSEKFECSWNHHQDVLKVVTPLSVSIHCQRTLWVQANSHNHCLLIRQHCQRALFGKMAWMLHCQNISILQLWKHNWKNPLPEAEAWRCRCSPGAQGCQNCLECLCWNPSTAGEDRTRPSLQVCSLPQQSPCRTFGEQTWAPRHLLAFACLELPAAFLQSKNRGGLMLSWQCVPHTWAVSTSPGLSSFFLFVIKCASLALQHWILSSQSALLLCHTSDFRLTESSIHYPWASHQILLNAASLLFEHDKLP